MSVRPNSFTRLPGQNVASDPYVMICPVSPLHLILTGTTLKHTLCGLALTAPTTTGSLKIGDVELHTAWEVTGLGSFAPVNTGLRTWRRASVHCY